jgi:DNA invertase Pin-like site-specific DNA recombinase
MTGIRGSWSEVTALRTANHEEEGSMIRYGRHSREEFNHLRIRFISIQDQVDTASPMGKAMFTIIGAMAEFESSLISERVKAGMVAAKARGKRLGRPATPPPLVARIEELGRTTGLSIRQIQEALAGHVSRSVVGLIVKRVRLPSSHVSLGPIDP